MKNNITVSLSKKLFQISLDWRYRNRLSAFIGSENKFLYNLQMILPEIVVCKAFQYMYTQNIMAQLSTARFTYILNCSGALPCISDVKHIPKSTLARIHNSRAIQTHPINHPVSQTILLPLTLYKVQVSHWPCVRVDRLIGTFAIAAYS